MVRKTAYKEISKFNTLKEIWKRGFDWKYWVYRLKWHLAPKLKFVTKFPVHLDIESTNCCNLKCIMCPHSNPTREFKKSLGFMDIDLFKKIIDEGAKRGLYSIKLNWRGEPLVHKKCDEMVEYAKKKGILEVQFNTNGLLLNKELSERLINAGLDRIIFSVDAASEETYKKIRRGGDYNKLLKVIKEFINIKKLKKSKKPFIRMQLVKMDYNVSELDKFIEMWSPMVDQISTQEYTSRQEGERKLTSSEESIGRLPCRQIWQRLVITKDGDVVMCCRDWDSEQVLGKLDYKNNKEVMYFWKGETLSRIREMHKRKELNKIPVCKKCTYKESYNWKRK
jgi:radical SAM protein with 4Fe4S-binding SPASM domain